MAKFHLARLAAEAITYANPTISPKANGIHTLKLCVLKFICSIKLLMNSISSIEFPKVQYKVYILTLQYRLIIYIYNHPHIGGLV